MKNLANPNGNPVRIENQVAATGTGALFGLRVLDLADPKGVYCTKLLADLGAEVIRIEPPGGDPMRRIGPFFHDEQDPEKSLYFFHFNTNKRSVTIDLEDKAGQEIFKKLIRRADILVETFQPGYLDRLGLGYQSLKHLNPALIVTSITGFGQTGPWRDYKSCDIVGLATGGLLHICGWPDRPPQRMGGSQAHYMASVQAASGTLMALYHRQITGEGQHVDVSMQQSVPVCMQAAILQFQRTGEMRKRTGDQIILPGQGIFPCKDGYVDIGQLSAVMWWDRLVRWLDSEGSAGDLTDAKYRDPFYRTRKDAIQHINEVIKAFTATRTKSEIFHGGQRKGVVIGPVNTPKDIANDPQLRGRNFFALVEHPELGAALQYLGAPFRLSATPWRISRRAPSIGEDNDAILGAEPPGAKTPAKMKAPSIAAPGKRLPLEGLRVVEFTEQVAGPMTAKALADYGAQVILVENEERARNGSSSRHPSGGASNLSSLNQGNHFNKFNTNKLSVTLNLKAPKGMELARKLIAGSDVVISNFVPRVLEGWGFSYDNLKKIRPDLILLTMPAFGTEGDYRDYRTLSWNLMSICGLDYASGWPDRPPIRANPWSHPDTSCQPFHALIGVLAAMYWRERTGQGQHVEVCQYESTLCFSETFIFDYLVNHRQLGPQGNRLSHAAPHGVYRCQGDDQWCAIGVFTEAEWHSLCMVIGHSELISDSRFSSLAARMKNAEALDLFINEWTQQKSPWEAMKLLQEAGVAAGAVETVEDMLRRDEQFRERKHWLNIPHPEVGETANEDWGFRLSAVPPLAWRHAPLLGEHNDLVLNGILGLSEAEINQLIIEGVVA